MTEKAHGAPILGRVTFDSLRQAARNARNDMRATFAYGFVFTTFYVVIGLIMMAVTWQTGQSYWLIFAAVGFPLIGPFAAVGLYEVSHRREQGVPLVMSEIMGVIAQQRLRQLPSICAVIIIIFLFWFTLAHMIFALFLGLSTMTNISSSFAVYTTMEGIMMLAFGSGIGALIALLIYMITVMSLPMLLDREVDFVTAMISSFNFVSQNRVVMLCWAMLIAVASFVALLPCFLGLYLVLPFFGHATWHLYRLAVVAGQNEQSQP